MGRRTARELAFKLLFQMEIQKSEQDEQIEIFFEENEAEGKQKEYIIDIVTGTRGKIAEIDKIVAKYLKGWKLGRLSKTDLSILRLAVYEILYREDIPKNVSINEAVELAKTYGSEESAAFINGVLGQVVKESLKNSGDK
ncbi:MAG: transcription antitermination factor NusB [Ignavibacteriales bacterium]